MSNRTVLVVAFFILLRSKVIIAPQAQMNKIFLLLRLKYDHSKTINSIDFAYVAFLRLFIS